MESEDDMITPPMLSIAVFIWLMNLKLLTLETAVVTGMRLGNENAFKEEANVSLNNCEKSLCYSLMLTDRLTDVVGVALKMEEVCNDKVVGFGE